MVNEELNKRQYRLKQGANEPCIFRDPNTGFAIVLYVDDILTRGSRQQTEHFHKALGLKFDCKPEEYLSTDNDLDFIGFSISQGEHNGDKHVYLDQQHQVTQLLDSFDRSLLQLKDSPMPTKQLMHSDKTPISENQYSTYSYFIKVI